MTPLDKLLARLRELEGKAATKPWEWDGPHTLRLPDGKTLIEDGECYFGPNEAELLTASRNALPVLLEIISRQNKGLHESCFCGYAVSKPCPACKAIAECDALAQQADNQP